MKSNRVLPLLAFLAAAILRAADPAPEPPVPDQLDLKIALGFALENNFAIRQAKERIRQQEGVVVEVRASQMPIVAVSASASYMDNHQRSSSFIPETNRAEAASLQARQLLYAGGGVTAIVRSQTLVRAAAMLALQAVVNDALLQVRTGFYDVLLARESIKVQEQNVELLQRQLQDVSSRSEAGTVSNFEVLRAEVALANAQPPLIRARNDYRLAIEQLRQALGFTTRTEPNLTKVPDFVGTLDFSPVNYELRSALAAAREQRPDLQRLRQLEDAAGEGVKAQQSGFRPNLSVVGSYDWQRSSASNSFYSGRSGYTLGLQSQWNIFDGRATAGRVAQARSQLEQSKLATAELRLAVDVEVRRAISSLQEATELAEASKKVVAQAEESLRLANARFAAGTATQLDVLTTQVALTEARLNQVQAYYRYNVAVAQVRKAMGLGDELVGRAP